MAYQMAASAVTLNDLKGHSLVAGLFKCNLSHICAAFTQFQLTICSHGSSALAELLVVIFKNTRLQMKMHWMDSGDTACEQIKIRFTSILIHPENGN